MIETKFWNRIRLIGERRLFFSAIVFLLYSFSVQAQMGCLDPQALNYDAQATISDGSCEYPLTTLPANEIADLPGELDECSGFVRLEEAFLGINDSGADAVLTFLDTMSFQLTAQTAVSAAGNVDWEELTQDDTHLYIGDFGNNQGSRTDLKIYKLPLNTLSADPQVEAEINFNYEDQTSFNPTTFSTPFDCEAFVVRGDSIHLFTKGWSNGFTKHYWLPNQAGNYEAALIDSFQVNGLITGASLAGDSLLLLTGYGNGSFCWILKDFGEDDFLTGNKRRIELGNLGQNETVTWTGEGRAIITNEGGFGTGKVFEVDFLDLITATKNNSTEDQILYYPNPFRDYLQIELPSGIQFELRVIDALGIERLQNQGVESNYLQTQSLPAGNYFLNLTWTEGQLVIPLIKL